MSSPVERAEGRSIDIALIALARDHVWPSDDKPALPPLARPPLPPPITEAERAKPDSRLLIDRLLASSGGFSLWGVFAGLALVPLVILVIFWISLRGPEDAGRPSASKASTELAARGDVPKSPSQVQTTGQSAPAAASAPTQDLPQSAAPLTRQIAEARQAIDRLTAGETRMLQENAELARRLKQTEETVQRNAAVVDDLKGAQAQWAQDKARLEAQLRASDEQLTKIAAQLSASRDQVATMEAQLKISQEQIGHLLDQKQRPKPRVASTSPTTSSPAPKPATAAPQQQAKPAAPKPPANPRAKGTQAAGTPVSAPVAGSR